MNKKLLLFILFIVIQSSVTFSQSYTQTTTTYSWEDITGYGTAVTGTSTGDDYFTLALPFTFKFFDTDYNSCYVNANGLMTFGISSLSSDNQCFPQVTDPNNCIAAYWDNLYFQKICAGAKWLYATSGVAPNRIFIVSWINFRYDGYACGTYVNTQIKLYETTNEIEVHLKSNTLPVNNSGTIGIENSTGTVGYYSICDQTTSDATAWKWTPNSGCTTPGAAGAINGTSTVCQGQSSVSYSVGAISDATSYVWAYSGTGATITGTTNSVTINFASNATSGNLTVYGHNDCGDGTVSANYPITVNTLPSASGTISGTSTVCQGQSSVSYSVGAITGATSYTWAYSGTGATITGSTNSVTINFASNATSGNLTVKGTNSCGSGTVSANYPITVNTLPSASGTISGTSTVCQGQSSVSYSVGAITGATSYTWAYSGTGATITGSTNSVTINFASNATSGNLTVKGTNSCGSGTVSANYPITVNTLPSASGTISGTSTVCQGQSSVSYSVGAITGATSYTWTYSGTGATITGSTNSVTINFASNATSGNLTVKGTNSCGSGTVSANYPITVNTLPSASGTISGTSTVCQGQSSVSYSVGAITGATSYTWAYSGTGATITGSTNSVTINFASNATSGNLTVKGTNSCGSGTVSANYPITVNPIPLASGTISGTSTVCQGQSSVSYSVGAITGATSYTWAYSGTGATITGSTNSVTINFASNATSGNLTVKGTNSCGSGTVSANYPITVNTLPSAAGTITGTASVCVGTNGVSYSVPAITNATSYTWIYSGSGATINGTTNNVTIDFSGSATTGNLTVKGTNSCGSGTVSANYPITVSTLPSASGTISGTSTVCQGQSSVSYSVGAITGATSYTWAYSGTGATITGSTNSVTINFASNATSGNLTVKGTNSCGSGTVSANYPITVNPLPSASGTISGTSTVCQGQSSVSYSVGAITGATSYTWAYSGTGATITGSTNSVTINFASNATSGNLTVKGTNSCGSGTVSANYPITVNPLPSAAGTITGTASVCVGTNGVSYSVPAITSATSYTWAYSGTGATITGSTNSVTINFASNATSGNLTVKGTNSCGSGTVSANYPITINPLPSAAGTITGTASVCVGTNGVSYSVPAITNATSYTWAYSGTGATITGGTNSVTISFASNATSGNLTVKGTNSCGSGTVSANYPITVNPLPSAAGTISGTSTVCQGQSSVSYSVGAITGATSYTWAYSGTGATITGSTNSVTISFASNATSGNLTVKGTNSCGSGTVSANYPITVNPLPSAAGTITGTASVCFGTNGVVYSIPAITNATGYTWTYSGTGATINGTTNNVTIDFSVSATSGNLAVKGTNGCGSGTISANYPITVIQTPANAGTITGSSTVCVGSTGFHYIVPAISGATSYIWAYSGSGATINGTTSNVTIDFSGSATSGVLTVQGTNSCATGTISSGYNITIVTSPSAAGVITGFSEVCQGQTSVSYSVPAVSGATAYTWTYTGTGATITGSTNSVTINFSSTATSGNLKVKGTNMCGSGAESALFPITVDPLPGSANSITGTSSVCAGQTGISYTVPAISNVTNYVWTYSGTGVTINGNTNTVTLDFASNATTGQLKVKGQNACGFGTISSPYTINITSGVPAAVGTISGPTALCAGDNYTLYSVSPVSGATSYQWNFSGNGGAFSNSTTNSVLSLADNATSGLISVYCMNICGAGAASPDLSLTVTPLPDNANGITGPTVVCAGQSGIPYSVSASANTDTYLWQYSGIGATINGNSENITINFAPNALTGQLKVMSQNSCGSGAWSDPLSIIVCPNPPTISTNPTSQLKCIGSVANFSVIASGTSLHYQWYKNGSQILNATSVSYSFTTTSESDEGAFYCEVYNECGSVFSDSAFLDINLPVITVQPTSQTRCAGDTVTFSLSATGSGLSYQWYKDGYVLSGKTQSVLSLNSLTSTNSGNYTCKVSTQCSSIYSDVAVLTVNQLGITSQPGNKVVCPGESVTFSVIATGLSLSYQWKKDGVDILGANASTYTIFSVASGDAGYYSCQVSNVCTTTISNSALLIINTPVITYQPTTLIKCPGTTAQFKVIATGSGLNYQWYQNLSPISGANSSTYNIGSVSDLYVGEYYCLVSNSCGTVSSDTVSLINNMPVITLQPVSQSACLGNSIIFSVAASGTGVSYKWKKDGAVMTGQTNDTLQFSSVVSGDAATYTCQVYNTCGSVYSNNVTLTLDNVVFNAQPLSQNVCENSDVALSVSVSGPGLTYQWTLGSVALSGENANTLTLNSIDVANAGTYACEITNVCGMVSSSNAIINVSNPLITLTSGVNTSCQGYITCSVSGGVSPYTYVWAGGQHTATITGVDMGMYYVTVTDAYGCFVNDSIQITDHPVVISQITSSSNLTCYSSCDGTAQVTASGGVAPYLYLWSAGSAVTDAVTGLCAGIYMVTVTDGNACTSVSQVTITEPAILTADLASTSTDCSVDNGSLTATINGGTTPYSLIWSTGFSGNPLTGLTVGDYILTVTDVNGCDTIVSGTIDYNNQGTLVIASSNASCYGICDGNATATIIGGTTPYIYNWSTAEATDNISGLCAGWYYLTTTDAGGCIVSDSVYISQPDSIEFTFNITNIQCNGGTNGSISTLVTGGTTPYSFLWSNDSASADTDNLVAGMYYLTVTDVYSCTNVDSAEVTEPSGMTAAINSTPTSCVANTGILEAVVSGGLTPYSFEWSGGFTDNPDTALAAGIYTITITDANGCTVAIDDTVFYNNAPTATITYNNVSCYGACDGDASVSVGGGTAPYSCYWSNGQFTPTINGLCAGTYYVTITDGAGCNLIDSIEIIQSDSLEINFNVTDITCHGYSDGAIDLTVAGGISPYTYAWSGSQTTEDLSNVTAGTYIVTVMDNDGCPKIDSVLLSDPALLAPVITGSDTVCETTATLSATGGFISYQWLRNDTLIIGANSSIYTASQSADYRVIVSNGTCTDTSTVHNVTIITVPVPVISGENYVCNGTTAIISVPDVYSGYQWKLNGSVITGAIYDTLNITSSGNYSVITNIGTCSKTSAYFNVTIKTPPSITSNPTSLTRCIGQTAQFSISATGTSNSYQWFLNGNPILNATSISYLKSNLSYVDTGLYVCQVANLCDTIFSSPAYLQLNNAAIIQQPSDVVVCNGDTVTFSVLAEGGGLTYKWYKNGTILSGQIQPDLVIVNSSSNNVGNYYCVVNNSCGSITSNTANLSLNDVAITVQPFGKTVCIGEQVSLNVVATGTGNTYQWYQNGIDLLGADQSTYITPYVTPYDTGSFYCVIQNSCNEVTSNTVQINLKQTIITHQPTDQVKCEGTNASFYISATGTGNTYQWKKDGVIIPGAVANSLSLQNVNQGNVGHYLCIITNSCNDVMSSDTAELIINYPVIIQNPVSVTKCVGDTAIFVVSGYGVNIGYQWKKNGSNFGVISNDTLIIAPVSLSSEADYTCKLSTGCGNVTTDPAFLDVHDLSYVFDAKVDTDNQCVGSTGVIMTDENVDFHYIWNNPDLDTTAYIQNLCSQYYTVVISDDIGCSVIGTVFLGNYNTSVEILGAQFNIHIYPNPANDGILNVYTEYENSHFYNLRIVDVLGREFYNETNVSEKNHSINLEFIPTGIYFLNLEIENTVRTFKFVIEN